MATVNRLLSLILILIGCVLAIFGTIGFASNFFLAGPAGRDVSIFVAVVGLAAAICGIAVLRFALKLWEAADRKQN